MLSWLLHAVAAGACHLDVLRWAIYSGSAWYKGTCTKNAAAGGHLEVLQWLLQDMGCTVDQSTCSLAAQGGHIETLRGDIPSRTTLRRGPLRLGRDLHSLVVMIRMRRKAAVAAESLSAS